MIVVLERRRLLGFAILVALVAAGVVFVARNWAVQGGGAPAGATLVSARPAASSAPPRTSSAGGPSGAPAGAPAGYFAAARLQRDQAESRELADLRALAADPATSAAVRAQAQEQILQLEQFQQEEAQAELVLQAKGFPQALVLLRPGGATAVVAAPSFDPASAALVAQAVAAAADLDPADVQIVVRAASSGSGAPAAAVG